jgi:hypothetical protein
MRPGCAGEAVGAPKAKLDVLKRKHAHLQSYDQLKKLHWDTKSKSFRDWGLHTEDIILASKPSEQVRSCIVAQPWEPPRNLPLLHPPRHVLLLHASRCLATAGSVMHAATGLFVRLRCSRKAIP